MTVDSDLAPSSYDCVGVLVSVYDGTRIEPGATRRFFRAPRELSLPFSFAVAPRAEDATTRVEVAVEALASCTDPAPGERVVRRAIRTGFLANQLLPVSLFLPASCGGCTVDETCSELGSECTPIPEYTAHDLLTADASTERPDAGLIADAFEMPPAPPRQINPLSTSTVTSQRPTLRWELAPGTDGARVVLCRDRACASILETVDAMGDRAQPTAPLAPGVVYWRVAGRRGSTTGVEESPTWEFFVGARSAGDTSWGSVYDWDGDGRADLATGAPYLTGGGRVYVYRAGETALETLPTALASSSPDSSFGLAIASGDVDGDGFPELIVGAPSADSGMGRIEVFRAETGSLLPTATAVRVGDVAGAKLGEGLAIGDVDGDGYADVAVGQTGMTTAGRVLLFRGGPDGLSEAPDLVLMGPDGVGDFFGLALAFGDFDGDGRPDLAVGAYSARRVHVFRGVAGGLDATPWVSLDSASVQFGVALANAGDVNGDGFGDLLVGSSMFNNGRAFVFAGSVSGLSSGAMTTLAGAMRPYYFGQTVGAGDFDGDGFTDVAVASSNEGRVNVYRGSASGVATTATRTLNAPDGAMSQFATALVGLGDIDGDGDCELAIGAPFVMSYAGRDYVYRGDPSSLLEPTSQTFTGPDLGIGRMGYSIASSL